MPARGLPGHHAAGHQHRGLAHLPSGTALCPCRPGPSWLLVYRHTAVVPARRRLLPSQPPLLLPSQQPCPRGPSPTPFLQPLPNSRLTTGGLNPGTPRLQGLWLHSLHDSLSSFSLEMRPAYSALGADPSHQDTSCRLS